MMARVLAFAAAAEAAPDTHEGELVRPEVTVVLPTYNERDNLTEAIDRVGRALAGRVWEIIVVDDNSPDGTHQLARENGAADPRVRCIRRIGRRGLAGACGEGMLAAAAPVVAVMDADLQHDERLRPQWLAAVEDGPDLAVGSRFAGEARVDDGLSGLRARASRVANAAARLLLGVRLSDPMSGFFMLRRETVEDCAARLTPQGYKVLLDIVASTRRRLAVAEFPFDFRPRGSGESKLDARVMLEFVALVASKLLGGVLSVRFILFGLTGTTGIGVHLATLYGVLAAGAAFAPAQTIATFVAMTSNFFLNNWLTFHDRRLQGLAVLRGLLTFYLVCGLGVIANVGVADAIHDVNDTWWIAGVAGALVGAVWNYAASAALTWRAR
jgi:dolichol-phosphate mannosyltransferase